MSESNVLEVNMEEKKVTMGTKFKMMVPGGWYHLEFKDDKFMVTFEKQEGNDINVDKDLIYIWSIASLRRDFIESFGDLVHRMYGQNVYLYPRYSKQLTLLRKFFWENADRQVVSICLRVYGKLTLENYNNCARRWEGQFHYSMGFISILHDTGIYLSDKQQRDWMFLRTRIKFLGMENFAVFIKQIPEDVDVETCWKPWKKSLIKSGVMPKGFWYHSTKEETFNAMALNDQRAADKRKLASAKDVFESANRIKALEKWLSLNDPLYQLYIGLRADTYLDFWGQSLSSQTARRWILDSKDTIDKTPNWLKRLTRKILLSLENQYLQNLSDVVRYLTNVEVPATDLNRWMAFWQKHLEQFAKNELIPGGDGDMRLLQMYRLIQSQDLSEGLSLKRTIENTGRRLMDERLAKSNLGNVVLEQPIELVIDGDWGVEFYSTLEQYYSRGDKHGHCLASYFEFAYKGTHTVFGLTDPEGNESTIMFERVNLEDGPTWVLNQHRGKYNAVVDTPEYTIVLLRSQKDTPELAR